MKKRILFFFDVVYESVLISKFLKIFQFLGGGGVAPKCNEVKIKKYVSTYFS